MNAYETALTGPAPTARPRMTNADRAKIFAPFAALRGFEESIHARELLYVPRPEPAPDRAEQLDRRVRALRRGDRVTVTWFQHLKTVDGREMGEYRVSAGAYLTVDRVTNTLILTTAHVPLSDLTDVGRR